jgi:hypothetical protein
MEWVLLAGLGVWVLIIQLRLSAAEEALRGLRRGRAEARDTAPSPGQIPPTRPPEARPPIPTAVSPAPVVPSPSFTTPEARAPTASALPSPPPSRSAPAPVPGLSAWLSENGLAWLGGGALALGGALLVAYAAEQGLFTPAFRIGAAVTVGFVMIAAGEIIRRQGRAPGGRHGLAAAMASAAGAVTLYAAIWAAYALYHFLSVALAAPLLGAVSVGLLALAFRHGEALGLLAIVGGFAAPFVCAATAWSVVALDGYLMLITLTGLGAVTLRRWARAGLLTLILMPALTLSRGGLGGPEPGSVAVLLVSAAIFYSGAALVARRSVDGARDLALAAWVAAGSEALGLAIHMGLAGRPEPFAYGAMAFGLALAARRLSWRGLPEAAALAALISLASMLGPEVAGAALAGRLDGNGLLLVAGAGVVGQAGAAFVLRGRAGAAGSVDAASTSALVSALVTVFLVLRYLATARDDGSAPLDLFSEAALRTLLLLAAGLVLSARGGAGRLARARGPVLLGLGALHGLLLGGLLLNPWWGWPGGSGDARAPVGGPPLADTLALAFFGPALLLAAAARRQARTLARAAGPSAVTAITFLALWALTEIRRCFHGPALDEGRFGYAEVAAYGVAAVALAWVALLARERLPGTPSGADPGSSRSEPGPVAFALWSALTISAWLLCIVASPWWGPIHGAFHAPALWFGLVVGGIALTVPLARRGGQSPFGRATRAAAVLEIFVLLTVLIRFAFHGAAMRAPLAEASVETWTYSAVWAAFGLLVLSSGARAGDRALRWLGLALLLGTTLKVFLFDMATLRGVIRAASFLALGAVLLAGALAARRLGGASFDNNRTAETRDTRAD